MAQEIAKCLGFFWKKICPKDFQKLPNLATLDAPINENVF